MLNFGSDRQRTVFLLLTGNQISLHSTQDYACNPDCGTGAHSLPVGLSVYRSVRPVLYLLALTAQCATVDGDIH